jgi:hypothetical protein
VSPGSLPAGDFFPGCSSQSLSRSYILLLCCILLGIYLNQYQGILGEGVGIAGIHWCAMQARGLRRRLAHCLFFNLSILHMFFLNIIQEMIFTFCRRKLRACYDRVVTIILKNCGKNRICVQGVGSFFLRSIILLMSLSGSFSRYFFRSLVQSPLPCS